MKILHCAITLGLRKLGHIWAQELITNDPQKQNHENSEF